MGSMHRSPAQCFPRLRGPPARASVISRSAYFMMPISARTGDKQSLLPTQSWAIQAQKFSAGSKHATSVCLHLGAAADAGGSRHGRLPALAVSPHFISATRTLNGNGSLTVNFKEAGLGTNQNINYILTAQATATYVCVNKGGTNPSAQNKTTVSGPCPRPGRSTRATTGTSLPR